MAAPSMCRSAQNDVCVWSISTLHVGPDQPATPYLTLPGTSKYYIILTLTPTFGGRGSRSARGRQESPAIHVRRRYVMNFACTYEKPCTHVRL